MVNSENLTKLTTALHAAIWTQQKNTSSQTSSFAGERYNLISTALKKWQTSWFSPDTIREPAHSAGLFQEGNFKWWCVALFLLERRLPFGELQGKAEAERVRLVFEIIEASQNLQRLGEWEVSIEAVLQFTPRHVTVENGLDTLTRECMITRAVV